MVWFSRKVCKICWLDVWKMFSTAARLCVNICGFLARLFFFHTHDVNSSNDCWQVLSQSVITTASLSKFYNQPRNHALCGWVYTQETFFKCLSNTGIQLHLEIVLENKNLLHLFKNHFHSSHKFTYTQSANTFGTAVWLCCISMKLSR